MYIPISPIKGVPNPGWGVTNLAFDIKELLLSVRFDDISERLLSVRADSRVLVLSARDDISDFLLSIRVANFSWLSARMKCRSPSSCLLLLL